MKSKVDVFNEKKQFVDELNKIMAVSDIIISIVYKADMLNGDEAVMVKDGSATPYYINVTGNSLNAILSEISAFQLKLKPVGLVESRKGREYYAKLFEEVA